MNRFFLAGLLLVLAFSVVFADDGNIAVFLLVDVSKSVPPEDLQKAKELADKLVQGAAPNDVISLYVFGKEFRKVTPQELQQTVTTESYTLLYDSTYDVARDLQKVKADRKAVVIVSDGLDTSSATVLDDTVQFANRNGISIYSVGVGKTNRKALERISKLTGGKFFGISNSSLIADLNASIQAQEEVPSKTSPPVVAAPSVTSPPVVQAPVPQTPAKPASENPAEESKALMFKALWAMGILFGVIGLAVFIWLIVRSSRRGPRVCPTCGRELDDYQTICPVCAKADTTLAKKPEDAPSDGTQEFGQKVQVDEDLIPMELLEKRPMGEESLTKTFVLMITPMLVVRKGKNLGQSYALNRAFPVSIGRSRVNEIRLDDISVSGQHCRIIPEGGRHVLYDLESTNGTLVNDKKATKVVLKEGDIIKVGETQFLYKVEQHRT